MQLGIVLIFGIAFTLGSCQMCNHWRGSIYYWLCIFLPCTSLSFSCTPGFYFRLDIKEGFYTALVSRMECRVQWYLQMLRCQQNTSPTHPPDVHCLTGYKSNTRTVDIFSSTVLDVSVPKKAILVEFLLITLSGSLGATPALIYSDFRACGFRDVYRFPCLILGNSPTI